MSVIDRIKALSSDDCTYDTFSGKADGVDSNVKFIIETDPIELIEAFPGRGFSKTIEFFLKRSNTNNAKPQVKTYDLAFGLCPYFQKNRTFVLFCCVSYILLK